MRQFLSILLIGCLTLAPPARAETGATGKPVVLVLGDSLSAAYGIPPAKGWVALLQRRLDGAGYGYAVVNASISGETTVGGLERLPRALARHRPAVVILELGGNDGLRGLPVEQLRANLEAMISASERAGARVVLAGIRIPLNYGQRYAEKFFSTYAELALARKTALVPFFLEGVAMREELFQDDGIHPGIEAQPILLDNVWPVLEPLLTAKGGR